MKFCIRIYYIIYQRLYVLLNNKKNNCGKILMLHDISSNKTAISITRKNYIMLLDNLKNMYQIQSPINFFENLDSKNILLTFDDPFSTFYFNGFKELKARKIPFILFINYELVGQEGYMNINQIKEILNYDGCFIGSHSMTHTLKRFAKQEDLLKELKEAKKFVENLTNKECLYYAFPFGSFYACSKKNIEIANKVYKYVFSTICLNYNKQLFIPRCNINDSNYKKIIGVR